MNYWFKPADHWNSISEEQYKQLKKGGYDETRLKCVEPVVPHPRYLLVQRARGTPLLTTYTSMRSQAVEQWNLGDRLYRIDIDPQTLAATMVEHNPTQQELNQDTE